jgi:tetratricopeptide (TPR) repeat protein
MLSKVACPECRDYNYPTDPVCLSCGADLRSPAEEQPEAARAAGDGEVSPADWEIVVPPGERADRLRRAQELELQVESLIEQGYHLLPKEPDARYGPADDVSDLCREIGECHMRNETHEEAARWFERALAISAGNLFARAYLVGALCQLGRHEEAEAWYEETPGDPIDKNVVRAWLKVPGEPAGPQRAQPAPSPKTERLIPSARRALAVNPNVS